MFRMGKPFGASKSTPQAPSPHIPSSKQEITRAGKSTLLPSTFPSSWFMKELVPFRERDQRVKTKKRKQVEKEKKKDNNRKKSTRVESSYIFFVSETSRWMVG